MYHRGEIGNHRETQGNIEIHRETQCVWCGVRVGKSECVSALLRCSVSRVRTMCTSVQYIYTPDRIHHIVTHPPTHKLTSAICKSTLA